MFTGIVEERGEVVEVHRQDLNDAGRRVGPADGPRPEGHPGRRARRLDRGLRGVPDGGRPDGDTFTVDVMAETLQRSTIGDADARRRGQPGALGHPADPARRPHRAGARRRHRDVVTVRIAHPAYDEIRIAVGPELARYLAAKGAVAVDGISLTVIDVVDNDDGAEFGIGVIPETSTATTMGAVRVGTGSTWRSMWLPST